MHDYYVDELLEMNIYVKALQDSLIHASWVKAIILVSKWQLVLSLNKRCQGKRKPGKFCPAEFPGRFCKSVITEKMETSAQGSIFRKWPTYKLEFFSSSCKTLAILSHHWIL